MVISSSVSVHTELKQVALPSEWSTHANCIHECKWLPLCKTMLCFLKPHYTNTYIYIRHKVACAKPAFCKFVLHCIEVVCAV